MRADAPASAVLSGGARGNDRDCRVREDSDTEYEMGTAYDAADDLPRVRAVARSGFDREMRVKAGDVYAEFHTLG